MLFEPSHWLTDQHHRGEEGWVNVSALTFALEIFSY
jgi:hypothetical protein